MITTISTCGWSSRTSTWRIVVVWIGGAETIASRSVTCESVSVVSAHRLVDLAAGERELERAVAALAPARAAAGRRSSGSRCRSARGPPTCAGARAGPRSSSTASSLRIVEGPAVDVRVGRERLGADGLARRREAVDHLGEQQLLARREHATDSRSRRPTCARSPRCGRPACRPASPPRRRPRRRRRTSRTVEVTTSSCSGSAHAAELDGEALELRPARRPPRSARAPPAPSTTGRAGSGPAGRPSCANSSSMWIGLKSPDAPA